MKNLFSILSILLLSFQPALWAQPSIVWENSFGGTWTDYSGDILVIEDGYSLALCNPVSPDGDFVGGNGYGEIWLMKPQLVKSYGKRTTEALPMNQDTALFQVEMVDT